MGNDDDVVHHFLSPEKAWCGGTRLQQTSVGILISLKYLTEGPGSKGKTATCRNTDFTWNKSLTVQS